MQILLNALNWRFTGTLEKGQKILLNPIVHILKLDMSAAPEEA